MISEWQQHMRKALLMPRSVERRAPSDMPEAVVSTAYYAMHHAACAVLLHRGERLPKTHSTLTGRFGLVVRDLGPDARQAGAALNEAFDRRSTGDYSADIQLGRADAIAARDSARTFIAYCRTMQKKPRR